MNKYTKNKLTRIVLYLGGLWLGFLSTPLLLAQTNDKAKLLVVQSKEHKLRRYHHPDLSPDGKQVAFSVGANHNQNTIWINDLSSGKQDQLTYADSSTVIGDVQVRWSPDGTEIGFVSDRGGEVHIYKIPAKGGNVQKITQEGIKGNPWHAQFCWAPDGKSIVHPIEKEGKTILVQLNLQTGEVNNFIEHQDDSVYLPDWSKDGTSFVYVRHHENKDNLWVKDVLTGKERVVQTDRDNHSYPRWSPDKKWLLFITGGSSGFESCMVPVLGGKTTCFGPGENYMSWGPIWDPKGNHVIYHSLKTSEQPLMIYDTSKKIKKKISTVQAKGLIWGAWAPNGKYFAYNKKNDSVSSKNETNIYLANIEDSTNRPVMKVEEGKKNLFATSAPAWMPDSKTLIAIIKSQDATQLVEYELASGKTKLLTSTETYKREPAISVDGELICFIVETGSTEDLWVYDRITEEEFQLTFSGGEKFDIQFSPDSETIAYCERKYQMNWDIYTVSLDGIPPIRQTKDSGIDVLPRWLDGKKIYYSGHLQNDYRGVGLINIAGNGVELLYGVAGKHVHYPFFNKVSNHLLYLSGHWFEGQDLFEIDLESPDNTLIVAESVHRPIFSTDGKLIAYIEVKQREVSSLWIENVEHLIRNIDFP